MLLLAKDSEPLRQLLRRSITETAEYKAMKERCMAHGHSEELTGSRRYRKIPADDPRFKWTHQTLVLQVEVSYWDYGQHHWNTKWRDATPADLPENQIV